MISAYAMVGKYISDQRIDAQKRYQAASDALEADEVALKWQTQPDVAITQFVSTFTFKDACSVQQRITDPTAGQTLVQKASAGLASETLAAGTTMQAAAGTTMQAAQKIMHDCEVFRQERYHLMAEDIRLRSWESILLGGDSFTADVSGSPDASGSADTSGSWTPAHIISSIVGPLVGWSNRMVVGVGAGFDEEFCKALKLDYYTKWKCGEVVRGIVEGTGSTSSAILGCITLYLVPALYSLIGAGAATMRYLRKRVETSTLRITDRPRISYNLILGCAFGAIIGLFARYLGSDSSIGPAAVALLAGFNVQAVFSFLSDLSNRVFGIAERGAAHADLGGGPHPG